MTDLYRVLQVDPAAEPEVIEVAYRRLARKYHPDVNPSASAGQRMRELNAAYEVLRDPGRRAEYDRRTVSASRAGHPREERPPDHPPEGPRCHRHQGSEAERACVDCGAPLCSYCAGLFRPPTCTPCVLRWTASQRLRVVPVAAFVVLLAISYAGVAALLPVLWPGLTGPRAVFLVFLPCAYLTTSFAFGLHALRDVLTLDDLVVLVPLAIVVGPVAAPVIVGRALLRLRHARRLRAVALRA